MKMENLAQLKPAEPGSFWYPLFVDGYGQDIFHQALCKNIGGRNKTLTKLRIRDVDFVPKFCMNKAEGKKHGDGKKTRWIFFFFEGWNIDTSFKHL